MTQAFVNANIRVFAMKQRNKRSSKYVRDYHASSECVTVYMSEKLEAEKKCEIQAQIDALQEQALRAQEQLNNIRK